MNKKKKNKKKGVDSSGELPVLSKGKQVEFRRKMLVIVSIFLLVMTFLWVGYFSFKLTGESVLSIDTKVDESGVSGNLKITLQTGELIPSTSIVSVQNENNTFEFALGDVISESQVEGDFFIEGKQLEGSGTGYGIPGEIEIFPEIDFEIKVISEVDNETIEEVFSGTTASDSFYENDIPSGADVEIVEGSVFIDGNNSSENLLEVEVSSDMVIVSTEYSEINKGFGIDYLNDESIDFLIPINFLSNNITPGSLDIVISYNDIDIITFSDFIEPYSEPIEEKEPLTNNETASDGLLVNDTKDESTKINKDLAEPAFEISITSEVLSLTDNEKNVLKENLGLIAVKTDIKKYDDSIVVYFTTSDYSMVRNYEIMSPEEISPILERDSVLWLRDLANHFLSDSIIETSLDNYSFSYSEF